MNDRRHGSHDTGERAGEPSREVVDPLHVFRDVDKAKAKLEDRHQVVMYALLDHRNRKTGLCNPSLPLLAKKVGKSERTVQRTLQELKDDFGIVTWEQGTYREANSYKFHFDALPLVDNPAKGRHLDVHPTGLQGGHSAARGWTSRPSRGDIQAPQGRHPDVQQRSEDLKKREDARVRARDESRLKEEQERTSDPRPNGPPLAKSLPDLVAKLGRPLPAEQHVDMRAGAQQAREKLAAWKRDQARVPTQKAAAR